MNKLLQKESQKQKPDFRVGDTVEVHARVSQGDKERIQKFKGVVISFRRPNQTNASFTVRKVTQGVGVEKVFPLYSPKINQVNILKQGKVRRSKLYYLRELSAKKSRIKERKAKTVKTKPDSEKNKK